MPELLTSAQMRAVERAAIEGGTATGLELMERAGAGVAAAIEGGGSTPAPPEYLSQDEGLPVVVLCGPGNNGGDGYVIARRLAERGRAVEVFALGDPARLPPDARANADRWAALGPVRPLAEAPRTGAAAALFVDALFGTGPGRPLEGAARDWALASAGFAGKVVAVDIPSGLCADSGRPLGGVAVHAGLSVSFHTAKPGHHLAEGPAHCGRLVVADIGLSGTVPGAVRLVEGPSFALAKGGAGHKYDHGHALVPGGGPGRGGAARLAARAALRVGAGLVTLACPPAALIENAARLDAVMLRPLRDATALAGALGDARVRALCLGPGLGLGAREGGLVAAASSTVARDAALAGALHEGCVLTPHAGEFARLCPDIAAWLAAPADAGPACSRLDAAREAAARLGCVVLLKGHDSVIAAPDGTCALHSASYGRAAPWLATAGAGDVLAGLVAGLMARGAAPFAAAETAAWLHVECARAFGPGLIAEDLPEALPGVLASALAGVPASPGA